MKTELYHWLGSLQIISGLVSNTYTITLLMKKGTSKFFILPASDNLATFVVGVTLLAVSNFSQKSSPRLFCHNVLFSDAAVCLAPLINAFMTIVAYVLQSLNEIKITECERRKQCYLRYVGSVFLQWVIPISICLTLYASNNVEKHFLQNITHNCTSSEDIPGSSITNCEGDNTQMNFEILSGNDISHQSSSLSFKSTKDEENELTAKIVEKIYKLVKESIGVHSEPDELYFTLPEEVHESLIRLEREKTTEENTEEYTEKSEFSDFNITLSSLTRPATLTSTESVLESSDSTSMFFTSSNEYYKDELLYESTIVKEDSTEQNINLFHLITSTDSTPPMILSTSGHYEEGNTNESTMYEEQNELLIHLITSDNYSAPKPEEIVSNNELEPQATNSTVSFVESYTVSNNLNITNSEVFNITAEQNCFSYCISNHFIEGCFLFIFLFCFCFPIGLGILTYISVNKKLKLSKSQNCRDYFDLETMHITNKMMFLLITASLLFCSPQITAFCLNFWFCINLSDQSNTALFSVSQFFTVMRCFANVCYLRTVVRGKPNVGILQKCQATVSPRDIEKANESDTKLFEKVNKIPDVSTSKNEGQE